MIENANIQVVLGSIDAIFNKGQYDRIPEFYSPQFKSHQGGFGLFPWEPGWEGLKEHVTIIRQMWPDYHEKVEIICCSGDLVTVRMTLSGTSTGKGTIPITGKRFEVKDMMICRVVDKVLVEQWGLTDNYTRLIQLDLMKPLATY